MMLVSAVGFKLEDASEHVRYSNSSFLKKAVFWKFKIRLRLSILKKLYAAQ